MYYYINKQTLKGKSVLLKINKAMSRVCKHLQPMLQAEFLLPLYSSAARQVP